MAAEYGSDAVLFYARQGDIDEVKRLVAENRSMANYTHVVTPLMWASYMGHCALANYLLDHGARVNQVEMGKGRTALYLAAGRGHSSMVSLLLKRGADPTIRRSGGWDALSVAASEAHIEVVQLLLDEAGVYVDGADSDGCTALHRASAWGRTDVVRLLLRRGADWRRVTHHKTALDMARDRHRAGCIAVLEDAERAYELTRARRMYQESSMIRTAISDATTAPTPTPTTTTSSSSSSPTSAPTLTSSVSTSSFSSTSTHSSSSSSSSSPAAAAAAANEAAAASVCVPAGGVSEATYTHTHAHAHTHSHTHTHRHTHVPFSFHHHRLYSNAHTHNTHVCCKGVCARSVTHPDDVVEWLRKRIEHHHHLPHVHIDDPVKPPQGKTGFWSKLLTGLSAVTSAKLSHIASAPALHTSTLNHDPPSAAEEMCAFASAANNHSNSHNNHHHRPPHHINNHTAHHSNNIINNAMAGASSPASVLPCVLAAANFSPAAGGGGASPTHAHAHTGSVCAGGAYNSAAGVAPTALYVVTQMKYDVVTQLMDFFV